MGQAMCWTLDLHLMESASGPMRTESGEHEESSLAGTHEGQCQPLVNAGPHLAQCWLQGGLVSPSQSLSLPRYTASVEQSELLDLFHITIPL